MSAEPVETVIAAADRINDAARSLGHSSATILARIHLPLMKSGVLTAALVVFVDCMKELPATLVLRATSR